MRKSNWIIIAILVVASIIFLAMWFGLGFNLVDSPTDLVITIVWWLIIIAVCLLINWSEEKRRRSIRTSFLGNDVVYNPEAGVVKVETENAYVPTLQKMLSGLSYDFSKDEDGKNDGQRLKFTYIVRSKKFANGGDTWTGEVVKVSNPDDIRTFNSKRELAPILG